MCRVEFPLRCFFSGCLAIAGSAIILYMTPRPLYGSGASTSVSAGVVRDVINYEGEESTLFVRSSFAENMYDTFYFNFHLLRDINGDSYDYTWNLRLRGIGDHLDFIAGNYSLNFGSGLMMGKRAYRSGDPFSRSITVTRDEPIIPSAGTNPAYPFFGSAVNVYAGGEVVSAGFIPFCSLQRRYVPAEDLSRGYISSSLATLSLKTDKSGDNSCGVNIVNSGGCVSLSLMGLFTLQGYFFRTWLRDDSGEEILWEYDSSSDSGVSSAESCGVFIGYDDDFFSFFVEPALSVKEYERRVEGRGVMWGAAARNRMMILSLKGKNCDRNFQAEYSSGDRNPENVFEIKTGIIPSDFFEAGILFYNEKNLKPASGRDYHDGILRKEVFAAARPVKWIDIDLTTAKVRSYRDDLRDEKIKVKSSLLIKASGNFFIRLKSDIQRETGDDAYVSAVELKYLFLDYFTLSSGFTDIRAGEGNSVYASIIPAPEAEMVSANYTGSARAGAVKLRYRKDTLVFHVRGEYVWGDEGEEATLESSLSFTF